MSLELSPEEIQLIGEFRSVVNIQSLRQTQQNFSLRDISTDTNTALTNWKNQVANILATKGYTQASRYIASTDTIGRSSLQIPIVTTNRSNNPNLNQQIRKAAPVPAIQPKLQQFKPKPTKTKSVKPKQQKQIKQVKTTSYLVNPLYPQ